MPTKTENSTALLALIQGCDTNTFSDVLISDGTVEDVTGVLIPDGQPYAIDPDGDALCGAKAAPTIAAEDGVGANNVEYSAGDTIVDFPGYGIICIPSKDVAESDLIFQPGETLPEDAPPVTLSDGTIIQGGDVVPEGELILFDGDETACLTKAAGVELFDCKNELLDGPQQPLTIGQGHAPAIMSTTDLTGCGVDLSCAPDLLECSIDGAITTTQNDYGSIMWELRSGAWVPIMASPHMHRYRGDVNSPDIDDTHISGAVVVPTFIGTDGGDPVADADVTLGNAWATIGTACNLIENDDCVPWVYTADWRFNMSHAAITGNFWTFRVIGTGDLGAGNFNGTAVNRIDTRCNVADCTELGNDLMTSQLHFDQIIQPGETKNFCAALQFRVNTHVPDNNNALTSQTFALNGQVWRSLCN